MHPTVNALARLLTGAALLLSAAAQAGDIFVYKAADGSRLITDHPRLEAGYTLVKVYSASDIWTQTDSRRSTGFKPRASSFDKLIHSAARRVSVDPMLIKSVMHAESAFNPRAVSHKGASGLMQLMPGTARRYDVSSVFDPRQNVMGGARYLRDLLQMFNGNLKLALAGYNAGENAVIDQGGVPPYTETRRYVKKVMRLYHQYRTEGCRRHVDSSRFEGRIISCSGATPATTTAGNLDVADERTVSSADNTGWRHLE